MKPVVAIDIDCVVCDFIGPFVGAINTALRINGETADYLVSDVVDYDVYKALGVPQEYRADINAVVATPGFCASLKPYDGALELVEDLRQVADVVAATSPWDSDMWMREREQWLVRELGFRRSDVIFTDKKHLLDVDALLDDKHSTVETFALRRDGLAVLLDQPWNRQSTPPLAVRACDLAHAGILIKRWLAGREDRGPVDTGWLVEDNATTMAPRWWGGSRWEYDASKAMRFAREDDATKYITCGYFSSAVRAAAHRFVGAR